MHFAYFLLYILHFLLLDRQCLFTLKQKNISILRSNYFLSITFDVYFNKILHCLAPYSLWKGKRSYFPADKKGKYATYMIISLHK